MMDVNFKSIAIIGEGETEWFYFDSLRIACRYPFKIAPDMPQHSDIPHMAKLAELYINRDYDIVICLVDMDRILSNTKELKTYQQIRSKSSNKIMWIETNPCTEFWFLLHFLPDLAVKCYQTCDDVLVDLRKYMPGYEKTIRYFRKTRLYEYLKANGNPDRAMKYADTLSRLSEASPEDRIAYTEINKVIKLLADLSSCRDASISTISERIGEVEAKILDFLVNSYDSDAKSISKAIGLRPSRTSDYLRRMVEAKLIVSSGEWRKTYRLAEMGK